MVVYFVNVFVCGINYKNVGNRKKEFLVPSSSYRLCVVLEIVDSNTCSES
jgi:hypothetical protein